MKKIVIIFLLMILIIGHENITFASYKNADVLEEELKEQLQETFEHRITVWNSFLIEEESSLEDAKESLKQFVGEPLLSTDIEIFTEMVDNPKSYEIIEKADINNCEIISFNNQKAKLMIDMLWVIRDYEKIDTEEMKYKVTMEKTNNKWLLTDYEITR